MTLPHKPPLLLVPMHYNNTSIIPFWWLSRLQEFIDFPSKKQTLIIGLEMTLFFKYQDTLSKICIFSRYIITSVLISFLFTGIYNHYHHQPQSLYSLKFTTLVFMGFQFHGTLDNTMQIGQKYKYNVILYYWQHSPQRAGCR